MGMESETIDILFMLKSQDLTLIFKHWWVIRQFSVNILMKVHSNILILVSRVRLRGFEGTGTWF